MNTIIQYIQIASAVYIVVLFLMIITRVAGVVFKDKPAKEHNLNGVPALFAGIATVICVVSVLVMLA